MSALPLTIRTRTNSNAGQRGNRPGEPAALDPLAEVRPWGRVEEGEAGAGPSAADMPLSDMVDRASAQLIILRRTLDEAASVNRAARQNATDLGQRLEQGTRLQGLLDQRIGAAGAATGILEKAATALRGLEALVGQIRGASGALEQRMNARLDEVAKNFEARLAEVSLGMERGLKNESERIGAEIDRRTAQVQARVSLVLDSASDRVQTLESQAEHIGGVITQRVETLCREAARVLGHDPRGEARTDPVEGSLAERLTTTRSLVRDAEDASIRLAVLLGEGESAASRVRDAGQEARRAIEGVAELRDAAAVQIEGAVARMRGLETALADAATRHDQALQRMAEAKAELATVREDLGTIGSAIGYHIAQAKEARESVAAACARADGQVQQLDGGLAEVRRQAEALLEVARDAAALVGQARTATTTEQTSNESSD